MRLYDYYGDGADVEQIKPRLDVAVDLENKFDYETLIDEAINNIQHIVLTSNTKYQVIKTEEEDIF